MININYRDSRPVYEQVCDGFKKLIIAGLIKKDEKMPSVRELASQYAINPNTIQRAYRDLKGLMEFWLILMWQENPGKT